LDLLLFVFKAVQSPTMVTRFAGAFPHSPTAQCEKANEIPCLGGKRKGTLAVQAYAAIKLIIEVKQSILFARAFVYFSSNCIDDL